MPQYLTLTARSRATAAHCMAALCVANGIDIDGFDVSDWFPENENFSFLSLISSAENHNLEAAFVRLHWNSLVSQLSKGPALLLLENGNFILALRRGKQSFEEIVISDPLYKNGEESFLPRSELEKVWSGNSVVVTLHRSVRERLFSVVIFGLSVCFVIAGILLLVKAAVMSTGAADRDIKASSVPSYSSRSSGQMPPLTPGNALVVADETKLDGAAAQDDLGVPESTPDEHGRHRASDSGTLRPYMKKADPTTTGAASSTESDGHPIPYASGSLNSGSGRASYPNAVDTDASGSQAIKKERASLPWLHNGTLSARDSVGTDADASNNVGPEDLSSLMERGDSMLAVGDLTAARLFYERAADAQNGQAALRLAQTYDHDFLALVHISGNRADASLAVYWYRRASELGSEDAKFLLQSGDARN